MRVEKLFANPNLSFPLNHEKQMIDNNEPAAVAEIVGKHVTCKEDLQVWGFESWCVH